MKQENIGGPRSRGPWDMFMQSRRIVWPTRTSHGVYAIYGNIYRILFIYLI